ncbi:hypothetical protein CbuD7D7780_04090 [Coxiella burnetii]|nr:hypothetical protein [Coxiella burnetii]OYK80458.1 hypothetical protein CbuD7E6568_04070 [Coxiella burnetii]OYK82416.1 hypothetical protein CbuD7D7780_04090 [Coxiella burnetii]
MERLIEIYSRKLGSENYPDYPAAIAVSEEAIRWGSVNAQTDHALLYKFGEVDKPQVVDCLLNLIWDQLSNNEHFSINVLELLRKYPDLIAGRLIEIDDLHCLQKVMAQGHIIRTLLTPRYLTRFFGVGSTALRQVESHLREVESRRFAFEAGLRLDPEDPRVTPPIRKFAQDKRFDRNLTHLIFSYMGTPIPRNSYGKNKTKEKSENNSERSCILQ